MAISEEHSSGLKELLENKKKKKQPPQTSLLPQQPPPRLWLDGAALKRARGWRVWRSATL